MIQQNQQTNKIMSWVMSINAATVHLSVTKSMKQRTGWFNNNFPSTSSHTSCFRLFFSAYYLRVQSCWTSGVKGCLSKTTKKTTSMTRTEIMVLKTSSQDWSRFCWKIVGQFFIEQKSHLFIIKKSIETSQKSTHESQKTTCCTKKTDG